MDHISESCSVGCLVHCLGGCFSPIAGWAGGSGQNPEQLSLEASEGWSFAAVSAELSAATCRMGCWQFSRSFGAAAFWLNWAGPPLLWRSGTPAWTAVVRNLREEMTLDSLEVGTLGTLSISALDRALAARWEYTSHLDLRICVNHFPLTSVLLSLSLSLSLSLLRYTVCIFFFPASDEQSTSPWGDGSPWSCGALELRERHPIQEWCWAWSPETAFGHMPSAACHSQRLIGQTLFLAQVWQHSHPAKHVVQDSPLMKSERSIKFNGLVDAEHQSQVFATIPAACQWALSADHFRMAHPGRCHEGSKQGEE